MATIAAIFFSLMCLVFCYVGWRLVRFGMKIGQVAALKGHSFLFSVGMMQTCALLLGVVVILAGVGILGMIANDYVDAQTQTTKRREQALHGLEASRKMVVDAEANYRINRNAMTAAERTKFEKDLIRAGWYASRSRDEVLAEADQYLPVTFLSGRAADKYNGELDISLAKKRMERMDRETAAKK